MDLLRWLYGAAIPLGAYELRVLELLGVGFGLASAIGGLRRRVWAWPVGIVGNLVLFAVYITATFDNHESRAPLFGQSGRQVLFILTSAYGWWLWAQLKRLRGAGDSEPAITPRWATMIERLLLGGAWLSGVLVCQWLFAQLGAGWPAPRWYFWADAWIFVGSAAATYSMARGWNEFWLAWMAVDVVGVPLLWHSGYIPTAVLYAVYGAFVAYGFVVWTRATANANQLGRGAVAP